MNQEAITSQINAIISKCWTDESFKQKLLADSATALKEEGMEIPAGYTVNVLENSSKVINFVLPPNPNAELSDAELESVAGGNKVPPERDPKRPRLPRSVRDSISGTDLPGTESL